MTSRSLSINKKNVLTQIQKYIVWEKYEISFNKVPTRINLTNEKNLQSWKAVGLYRASKKVEKGWEKELESRPSWDDLREPQIK